MQKLILAEDIFDQLKNGKTCTIRKGRRDVKLKSLLFESLEKGRLQEVNVDKVIYCQLQDIPEEYLRKDGFENHEELMETMQRFYPDILWITECTIVDFTIK